MNDLITRRIYGRRKGRALGKLRQNLLDTFLKKFIIEIDDSKKIDPKDILKSKKVWLEIGFGAGDHLVEQAEKNKDIGLIGCDSFENAVSSLLKKIQDKEISNILIYDSDARNLVDNLIENSIDSVFILFPDPWPKAKHHKRRIIQKEFIDDLYSKIV